MKIINTTDKNRCNCVLWLRDRLSELPYGLWTLDDKKNTINSSGAVVGCGAISKDGVWFNHNGQNVFSGHVALVTGIDGDKITIREANYKSCTITEREGTMDELKIIGFFVPDRLKKEDTENHVVTEIKKASKKYLGIDVGNRINEKEDKKIAKAIKKLYKKVENN